MHEDHPLKPLSPYASAKCGADRLVWSYVATYDLPAVIIRPFNNYGPRQHLEKVVPCASSPACCSLRAAHRAHFDGAAARDFVFVDDNCHAIAAALTAPLAKVKGRVFRVGSGVHRSILEIARDVLRVMGGPESQIKFVGERPGQVFRHTADAPSH